MVINVINMSCAICQEDFVPEDHSRHTLECQHEFHTACIVREFRERGRCPLCRDDAGVERQPALNELQNILLRSQRELQAVDVAISRAPHLIRMHHRIDAMRARIVARERERRRIARELRDVPKYRILVDINRKIAAARGRIWAANVRLRIAGHIYVQAQN